MAGKNDFVITLRGVAVDNRKYELHKLIISRQRNGSFFANHVNSVVNLIHPPDSIVASLHAHELPDIAKTFVDYTFRFVFCTLTVESFRTKTLFMRHNDSPLLYHGFLSETAITNKMFDFVRYDIEKWLLLLDEIDSTTSIEVVAPTHVQQQRPQRSAVAPIGDLPFAFRPYEPAISALGYGFSHTATAPHVQPVPFSVTDMGDLYA